ncbi:hypothetical protein E2562_019464 [Oryza meyeriana var. granulata]|uniref:Uncharacterized protein n=1 Tax=Oryza meyeriana var. granulata TaxID=110450 RepID=A0A6G1DKE6_9ORYZ|nr:hypothetical protein E2562_019464 [Oryza meyeriana var. granulata]
MVASGVGAQAGADTAVRVHAWVGLEETVVDSVHVREGAEDTVATASALKRRSWLHARVRADVDREKRVDGGLKTVVSARKFVPGAKLCMQPDIKPNKRKSRSSRKERCRTQAPLLPGLPDDLAITCLMRVPRVEHTNLRCGSHSLQFQQSIQRPWALVVPFSVAAICTCLVAKIQSEGL